MNYQSRPLKVVLSFDPAIDRIRSDVALYLQTRDLSHLAKLPGHEFTIFNLRHIPRSIVSNIHGKFSDDVAVYFMHAIESIENMREHALSFEYLESKSVSLPVLEWKPAGVSSTSGKRIQMLSEDELSIFNNRVIEEIGMVARDRSFLVPGIKAIYQPSDICITLCHQLHSLAVAAQKTNPDATQETEPSASAKKAKRQ